MKHPKIKIEGPESGRHLAILLFYEDPIGDFWGKSSSTVILSLFDQKNYQDLKDQKKKLDKNYQEDQKAAQQEKDRLKALTVGCVQQLGRCLSASGSGGLTQVACRFLSLWFDHNLDYPEATRQ